MKGRKMGLGNGVVKEKRKDKVKVIRKGEKGQVE